MIEIAERLIRENYQGLGLTRAPSKIGFVKMGGRQDRSGSVPFACFLGSRGYPTFYVKFPRNPANQGRLRAEFENLRRIHDKTKNRIIKDSIPLPLWYNKNPVFTVQGAVNGVPMLSDVTRRNFSKSTKGILSWLSRFHEETKTRQVVYQKYARGKIDGMMREIGAYSRSTGQIFSRALEEASVGEGAEMPLTYIHGDFNPHNILMSGRKLGVFDWEESSIGLPFIDVFHYFTVSSFSVEFSRRDRGLSKEERYREHFLENLRDVMSLIRDNYGLLALDKDIFTHTYIFYLTHMAVNEIRRDRLINWFELWVNLLKMFSSRIRRGPI